MNKKASPTPRSAKMDIKGFSDSNSDLGEDMGREGVSRNTYDYYTTGTLPQSGKNSALDDDEQPVGSGAQATTLPGAPLKTPMKAGDVNRPKIRDGREAATLMQLSREVAPFSVPLARRLAAVSRKINAEALATGDLQDDVDDGSSVDESQDNLSVKGSGEHGTLKFYGTAPARKEQLASRKRKASSSDAAQEAWRIYQEAKASGDTRAQDLALRMYNLALRTQKGELEDQKLINKVDDLHKQLPPGPTSNRQANSSLEGLLQQEGLTPSKVGPWEMDPKVTLYQFKDTPGIAEKVSAFAKTHRLDWERDQGEVLLFSESQSPQAKMEFASRRANSDSLKKVNWKNTMALVEEALNGKYDPSAVARILHDDYQRTISLLKSGLKDASAGVSATDIHRTAKNVKLAYRKAAKLLAQKQGDSPTHPDKLNAEADGTGAGGAGGFADKSKAPLQKTMTSQDIKRPEIRENPQASKKKAGRRASQITPSPWDRLKSSLRKACNSGQWEGGSYEVNTTDLDSSLEVNAEIKDREGNAITAGNITLTLLDQSNLGRYASVEVIDGLVDHKTANVRLSSEEEISNFSQTLTSSAVKTAKLLLSQS